MASITPDLRSKLLTAQRTEITEHQVYNRLAALAKDERNRQTLQHIARDEMSHYKVFSDLTGRDVRPVRWRVAFFVLVARLLGLTFGLKLMERGEEAAQRGYGRIQEDVPALRRIRQDEEEHENALLAMLADERLDYAGSIVLGLNDALVELTGALAGFSLAFQNVRLIALSGLVTGIAAALSMAASEYLSTRAEEGGNAGKSALYTGVAYIITVFLLVGPYLILHDYLVCLALALGTAVLIILIFTFYISVAKDLPFRRRFLEMAGISLGVAAFSFVIGLGVKRLLGVDVG
jgi:VIT1/CCC1 family predicted Fe2+/Mn2+ transporter